MRIEAIRWETSYYSAHDTFQKQIPEAADCDVVVAIFRGRLGTPLPAGFPHLPTGEAYPSGTAYEVLSAIEVRKAGKGLPDVYVFRYPNAPSVLLDAPDRAEIELQWGRLKKFFDTWFRTKAGEFVAAFQTYASTDDFATQVEDCLRQWLARRGFLAHGRVWDRVLHGSPFPGLAAFGADRGSVFFGRDLAVAQSIERLREAGAGGKRLPFLLVIGASGSGKSSLLRAGLLPRLTLPGTIPEIDLWRTAIVTPGPNPFLSLAESLFADAALGLELRRGTFRTKEMLARQLAGDPDMAVAPLRDALDRAIEHRRSEAQFETARPVRLALALDQAERLFVEADAATAVAFAALLSELVRQQLAYLVMVLLSDAYARFQGSDALVGLREAGATFDLVPPNAAELEEIVTRPVAACHPPLAFEQRDGRSLAALLVGDAKGGDALPLLQMTLARLYAAEAGRGDGLLRFADYRGMDAAVTETANEALDTLDEASRAELPALVAGLVADVAADPLTGDPLPVVAALDRRSFEARKPARQALVEAFVAKRLLTAEGDGVFERVRPVHEALLRIWPQAVAIVGETAALIRVRHTLEPMVREWQAAGAGYKAGHLEISPALLDGAQQALTRMGDDLPPAMRDFIVQAAAVDAERRDRARQEQERRIRDAEALAKVRKRVAQTILAGLAAALALAVLAAWQWRTAEGQRAVAEQAERAATAEASEAARQATLANAAKVDADQQRHAAELSAKSAEVAGQEARNQAEEARRRLREAQLHQSQFLTAKAEDVLRAGDPESAGLIARAALPISVETPERPLWSEAVMVLGQARDAQRQQAVLLGHQDSLADASFSPDGTRVVTTSYDNTARVWDARTGAERAALRGHTDLVTAASFSPDGKHIVSASKDGTVRIWDAGAGTQQMILRGHSADVVVATYNADGARILTASKDHSARIWDANSGTQIVALEGHTGPLLSASFSPDGSKIVTASTDRTARLWDAGTGRQLAILAGHKNGVISAAFSPDGTRVVTGSADATARVWDVSTGVQVFALTGHTDSVLSAMFSPTEMRIVTASVDDTGRLWNAETGELIAILRGHETSANGARFSPDGSLILTNSNDGTARLWDGMSGSLIAVLRGHSSWVNAAAFSPDGSLIVTASRDKSARIWSAAGVLPITFRAPEAQKIVAGTISPRGARIVTTSDSQPARLWDQASGVAIATLEDRYERVLKAAFSRDGTRLVTTLLEGGAQIWNASDGRRGATLKGSSLHAAVFSPEATRLAAAYEDNSVRVWNTESGELLVSLPPQPDYVESLVLGPGGARIVTYGTKVATLWNIASNAAPTAIALVGHSDRIRDAAFNEDGTRIVTASEDKTARVWDAADGVQVAMLQGHTDWVDRAAFSPDGSRIVTYSTDLTARLWDARSGAPIAVLAGHSGLITSAEFSSDGARLVTASNDTTARLWDVANGATLAMMTDEGTFAAAKFNADATQLLTFSTNNIARLWSAWPLLTADAVAYADVAALRGMTIQERKTAFLVDANVDKPANSAGETCDRLAGYNLDPQKQASGVLYRNIDAASAVPACQAAVAAAPDEPRYHYQLGRALDRATKVKDSTAQYQMAADKGYPAAIAVLATATSSGYGLPQDKGEALRRYRTAAEAGFAPAFSSVADFYLNGVGTAQDRGAALDWLRRGAEHGDPFSHQRLAELYETGDGVPLDVEKSLYHRAIEARLFEAAHYPAEKARARRGSDARALPPATAVRVWRDAMHWQPSGH